MAIVLIMGIPGAGKSTVARQLCDAILGQSTAPGGPSTVLQRSLDDALSEFDPQMSDSARANRRRWQQSVESDLAALPSTSDSKHYVVVDDIFYLASMRRPFQKMARRHRLAFLQVFVDCPLELAQKRNRQRPTNAALPYISDDDIRSVYERFERPDEAEANTRLLDAADMSVNNISKLAAEIIRLPPPPEEDTKPNNPPMEPSKWETLDIELRRIVRELLSENEELRRKSDAVSYARRKLHAELKYRNVERWSAEELKEELKRRINSY